MGHKLKSLLTLGVIFIFMITIAFFVNHYGSNITGATVIDGCSCFEDMDCNDGNFCTEDICLYPNNCEASICINKEIADCNE